MIKKSSAVEYFPQVPPLPLARPAARRVRKPGDDRMSMAQTTQIMTLGTAVGWAIILSVLRMVAG